MTKDTKRKLWPFRPWTSIIAAILLLAGLMVIVVVLRRCLSWPDPKTEPTLLIGVFLIGLLPILLSLADVIIERGGVIEAGGMKFDFSQTQQFGVSSFNMPVNIGVRGEPVMDSSTTRILDSLKQAIECGVVVIDLEEGQAWWETRLLVLLAGAARLGRPDKVVFVGRDGGTDKSFQGWGRPKELLGHLLKADAQYEQSYHAARAAAQQWELVEPPGPRPVPPQPTPWPPVPTWMHMSTATDFSWMAFDDATGLPNPLLAEQFLAAELGSKVESQPEPRRISLTRLEELFRPVLIKESIDETWASTRQMTAFFDGDAEYFVMTRAGRYVALVPKFKVLNSLVRSLFEKELGKP